MDKAASEKGLIVKFGGILISRINNYPLQDQKKIYDFANHIQVNGFSGLPGRNKSSTDVDKNDHQFIEKVRYASVNSLYHYHIGIPNYDKTNPIGDWTSEYILHYQYLENVVTILDLDSHPPFNLPPEKFLA